MKTPAISPRVLFRALVLAAPVCGAAFQLRAQSLPNDVMFVTQVPMRETVNTVTSIGGSHLPTTAAAPRGGDLMIRYTPDGSLKNVTRSAGYGEAGSSQGADSIAVRDPQIHWSGQRAIFSMVVGVSASARWQMYEVTGLGKFETPVITKVPNQPALYNNVQPCYSSADNIIFVSDRPRDGSAHLYPARDEKGQGEINTGLWQLNPVAASLTLMEHSPSGSFDPFVDSHGRIVFSRWDHLQRDELTAPGSTAGGFDFASEAPGATGTAGVWSDVYPDPLPTTQNPLGLKFDQFLPWTLNQDGTDLLTINHLGRHEMTLGFNRSRPDSNLQDFVPPATATRATSFLQIRENPAAAGSYITTDVIFTAVSAGKVLTFTAPPSRSPATGADLAVVVNTGLSRDPSLLTNGRLMVSFSPGTPNGTLPLGNSSYGSGGGGALIPPPLPLPVTFIPGTSAPFKIKTTVLTPAATVNFGAVSPLNPDTTRSVTNTVNGQTQIFSGTLWELQPVEIRATTRPPAPTTPMDRPELEVFTRAGVSPTALREWMKSNDLALLSTRNVTTRDAADKQQPTSLKVEGGVETIAPGGGPVYTVTGLQFFQADYVRGYGMSPTDSTPDPGRRVTARVMQDDKSANPVTAGGPGHVGVSKDGSMAAFVPSRRALSWQLADINGDAIVRERYWLSFQAGEIRSCTSCHGVNSTDQAGHTVATNAPQALSTLLNSWKQSHPEGAASTFQVWSEGTLGATLDPSADNDADGITNFEEYAYGSPPLTAAAPGDVFIPLKSARRTIDGQEYNSLIFSRSLSAYDLAMTVESSPDMTTWTEVAHFGPSAERLSAEFTKITKPLNSGQAQEVQLTHMTAAGPSARRFYRLRMESP